ncbi:unnamed protein product [Heligmosomoides polygyrus]|uniref:RYDR_ITPR domain-containing protein n=1 Tax=Heligmosomoides polygyrus TaxID=6339 RepID=A0A183GNI7_HELPZ|nr:unnamed protein product [Heligmosomoides polygyrus]
MANEMEEIPFAPPATGEEECAMRGAETDESRTPQTVKQLTEQFKEMGREQVVHFEAQGTDSTHSVLEETDPHVLFAYAKRRLERGKERNQTYCGHSAMKERLQEDGNVVRVKALAQLRKLNMRPDQTVEEFCAVLEKFVGKAYPDTPQEAVSLQMAEILFTQLAHWPGSYSLSEAIETSNGGEAYDSVKKAALRLERSRSAARERECGAVHNRECP